MEASVVSEAPAPEAEPAYDGSAEATRSSEELFEWSGYVHVGKGAEECEKRLEGCKDPHHFHGWVCLPNSFQIRDIDDKARAGEARKLRALRDAGNPDKGREPSDSYVTLEAALDAVRFEDDELEIVKVGIVSRTVDRQLGSILEEMAADDRFKHQAQHAQEMQRVMALPEDERDADEVKELSEILQDYGDALQARIDERHVIERAALDQLTVDQIIDIERRARSRNLGEEYYLHTYYTWCMYVCTYEPTIDGLPSVRKFPELVALKSASPEAVAALRQKITELETRTSKRGDAAGN